MNNYEKAMKLVVKSFAGKHYTFNKTGYLVLNLGKTWFNITDKSVFIRQIDFITFDQVCIYRRYTNERFF